MSAHAPQLRADLNIIGQVYRDEQSYVVKDPVTHDYFRFRPVEVQVMRLFDGVRTVHEIADALVANGVRLSAATIEKFARKLAQLGLLERTLKERTTQQLERLRSERQRHRSLFRGELFRMRWSFGNPNNMLSRFYPKVRWCFTTGFVIVSSSLFVVYLTIVGTQGKAFAADVTATFSPTSVTPSGILILILTLSVLTLIHELGHAFACKHFGGDVHEMGFMLLYLTPAFFANVNDAWSFQERRARLWVTAAGGWIELTVTALFSIVWLLATPGTLLSQVSVAAMIIGGLANILTNANPLIPLDGYFALGDWLEISNLRMRAKQYVANWGKRHLLRMDVAAAPVSSREARILLTYGLSAAVYSTLLLAYILIFVVRWAERTLGVLVAGTIVAMVLVALRQPMTSVVSATRLAIRSRRTGKGWRGRRGAILITAGILLVVTAVIPCSLTTGGTFEVLPSSSTIVSAPANGVVSTVFVREGDLVVPGAPVMRLVNFELERDVVAGERITDSLTVRMRQAQARQGSGERAVLQADADVANAMQSVLQQRTGELHLRTSIAGQVLTKRPEQLLGKHVQFGDPLVVVADLTHLEAVLRLRSTGAVAVQPGQPVRLLSYLDTGHPVDGVVASVLPSSVSTGMLEARVVLKPGTTLRPGATGEGRVVVGQSTLLVAIMRAIRSRIRIDLFL